jgi:hypothetical protein
MDRLNRGITDELLQEIRRPEAKLEGTVGGNRPASRKG